MEKTIGLAILIILSSCSQDKSKKVDKKENKSIQVLKRRLSYEELFDLNYKISDFKTSQDSSRYFARVKNFVSFYKDYDYEIEELKEFNGLFLICKIPLVKSSEGDTILKERGMLFEQNCYWFENKKATEIKNLFKGYLSTTQTDKSCSGCLDHSYLKVEQLDKGKYNYITKDYLELQKKDQVFIDKLKSLINNYKEGKHFFGVSFRQEK